MPTGSSFAERLRDLMRTRNLSAARLADELGVVSERTIWRWRAGLAVPGAEALVPLSRALGTTPNHLVGFKEDE